MSSWTCRCLALSSHPPLFSFSLHFCLATLLAQSFSSMIPHLHLSAIDPIGSFATLTSSCFPLSPSAVASSFSCYYSHGLWEQVPFQVHSWFQTKCSTPAAPWSYTHRKLEGAFGGTLSPPPSGFLYQSCLLRRLSYSAYLHLLTLTPVLINDCSGDHGYLVRIQTHGSVVTTFYQIALSGLTPHHQFLPWYSDDLDCCSSIFTGDLRTRQGLQSSLSDSLLWLCLYIRHNSGTSSCKNCCCFSFRLEGFRSQNKLARQLSHEVGSFDCLVLCCSGCFRVVSHAFEWWRKNPAMYQCSYKAHWWSQWGLKGRRWSLICDRQPGLLHGLHKVCYSHNERHLPSLHELYLWLLRH